VEYRTAISQRPNYQDAHPPLQKLSKPEASPSLSEPMKTVIFDRFFFVVVTRTLPTERRGLIWSANTRW
jgi:hypothetical protein